MTKVIIISGGNLDSYYEQVQQYLKIKYHTYPSNLLPLDISEGESLAFQSNGKMAHKQFSGIQTHQDIFGRECVDVNGIDVPIGKFVG